MIELLGINPLLFFVLVVWSLVWKGWALWIAARKESRNWFVILLILNTVGILEILYIFIISKRKGKTSPENTYNGE